MRTLLLLTAVLALTACTAPAPAPPTVPATTTARATTTAGSPADAFTSTDTGWLQLMVSMDTSLLDLLDLAPAQATPGLRPGAEALRTHIAEELAALTALRDRAGLPVTDIHEGHPMPGRVTEAALLSLRGITGADFDTTLVTLTRGHLDQAGVLADGVTASGSNPDVKALAARIRAEHEDLKAALAP